MHRLPLTSLALLLAACAGAPPPHRPMHGGAPPRWSRGGAGAQPPRDTHLFVSPMGEPFRGGGALAPDQLWFAGADSDHDGRLTLAEFKADALRFFATLDTDHDGEIGPEEITRYETEILPEVHSASAGGGGGGGDTVRGSGGGKHRRGGDMGGGGGGRGMGGGDHPGWTGTQGEAEPVRLGAARFSYLDLPEPVIAADADMNRGVSRPEFLRAATQRFALLDTGHADVLTHATLPPLPHGHGGAPGGRRGPPPG